MISWLPNIFCTQFIGFGRNYCPLFKFLYFNHNIPRFHTALLYSSVDNSAMLYIFWLGPSYVHWTCKCFQKSNKNARNTRAVKSEKIPSVPCDCSWNNLMLLFCSINRYWGVNLSCIFLGKFDCWYSKYYNVKSWRLEFLFSVAEIVTHPKYYVYAHYTHVYKVYYSNQEKLGENKTFQTLNGSLLYSHRSDLAEITPHVSFYFKLVYVPESFKSILKVPESFKSIRLKTNQEKVETTVFCIIRLWGYF